MSPLSRTPESHVVPPAEAQEQPQAPDPLYHSPAAVPGAQVPPEAVPVDRGASGVLERAEPDGDPGQDLVSEPARQGQAPTRSRAGEAQAGRQARAARTRPALRFRPARGRPVPVRDPWPRPASRRGRPGPLQLALRNVLPVLKGHLGPVKITY